MERKEMPENDKTQIFERVKFPNPHLNRTIRNNEKIPKYLVMGEIYRYLSDNYNFDKLNISEESKCLILEEIYIATEKYEAIKILKGLVYGYLSDNYNFDKLNISKDSKRLILEEIYIAIEKYDAMMKDEKIIKNKEFVDSYTDGIINNIIKLINNIVNNMNNTTK